MTLSGDSAVFDDVDSLRTRVDALIKEIEDLSFMLDEKQKEKDSLLNRILELTKDDEVVLPIKRDEYHFDVSSNPDKAKFFLDIFSPNENVYAVRSYHEKTNKVSYYPLCNNFKKTGCVKEEGKSCRECHSADYAKLTPDVVLRHFSNKNLHGEGAIGIYLMKKGDVVRSAAIDFDEKSWYEDAMSVLKVARQMGVAMAIERSFSGNGAHLWVFFKEDIPAIDARKLLFAILDKTRECNPSLPLSSYDRMFPSQDHLSKGGIGNLILLPLVNSAAARGNTLFLDDAGHEYPPSEQIEYLASLHKHSYAEIKTFLKEDSSRLFELKSMNEDELNPSWIKRVPRLSASDFKDKVILYLSTGISFDKKVLSLTAQEALRRIATIYNPEYYKQKNKYDGYIGSLSSRVPLYEESDRVLKLPRGLMKFVLSFLDGLGIRYEIEDHRVKNTGLDAEFTKVLKPEQMEALDAMMGRDCAILSTAPSFGKTAVALALIAKHGERTMVIVNSTNLLEQWKGEIDKFLDIKTKADVKHGKTTFSESVGSLGGGKDRLTGVIDIVMLQSIASRIKKGNYDFTLSYGMVIIDECHHIAAEKSRFVLKNLNPKYVYGLSATVKRRDGLEKIVFSECGEFAFSYGSAKLASLRGIQQLYIARFLDTSLPRKETSNTFNDVLDRLSCDERRSCMVADDIETEFKKGRRCIVFTRRLEQNRMVEKSLTQRNIPSVVLDGSVNSKKINEAVQSLRSSIGPSVLIATDKLLGEGLDIPGLDTLFLASPYMQEGVISQCVGRLSRASEGKKTTLVYDYVDYRVPILSHMFTRRISIYKKLGYSPLTDSSAPYDRLLYDDLSFEDKFIEDIKNAQNEVIISSSLILPSRISKKIIFLLAELKTKGVSVSLRGNNGNSNEEIVTVLQSMLDEASMSISAVDNPKNFAAIDRRLCWYGELNVMSVTNKTASSDRRLSIMRIVDNDTTIALVEDDQMLLIE